MNDEVKLDETTGEAVGTQNDARLAMLEQINDANDKLREDELEAVNDDGTTTPFVVKSADGEETELTDEAKTEEIPPEGFTSPEIRHKIKVNGREIEVSTEELIARAQKIEAADQYLAEAARLRNEAQKQSQPSPDADLAKQQEARLEEAKALARALQMGSEDEAAAVILKLQEKAPSIRPDEISKTIDERLTFNEAISEFRKEYKDLVEDPRLHQMVLDRDAELIKQGDRRPYLERYQAVGEEIRSWVNKFKPAVSEETKTEQTKLSRKAAAPSIPKTASGKTVSSVEEEKEESTSDTIRAMAASRGGPQWMQGMDR